VSDTDASRRLSGFPRLLRATRVSGKALAWALREEEAFRLEALALLLVIPLALWLGDTGAERALLCGAWLLVLIVELLNTGLEVVVDRIGPEHHVLSGRAKDIGSAAVLLALLNAALVWGLVLVF